MVEVTSNLLSLIISISFHRLSQLNRARSRKHMRRDKEHEQEDSQENTLVWGWFPHTKSPTQCLSHGAGSLMRKQQNPVTGFRHETDSLMLKDLDLILWGWLPHNPHHKTRMLRTTGSHIAGTMMANAGRLVSLLLLHQDAADWMATFECETSHAESDVADVKWVHQTTFKAYDEVVDRVCLHDKKKIFLLRQLKTETHVAAQNLTVFLDRSRWACPGGPEDKSFIVIPKKGSKRWRMSSCDLTQISENIACRTIDLGV